jgi:hypothetical protein
MKVVTSKHRAAVAALEAEHGRDAELTATVVLPAGAEVAVAGEELKDWTGAMLGVLDAESLEPLAGSVLVRAPNGATFAIGELSEPRDGDQVYGTVGELIEHPAPMRLMG